MAEVVDEWTYSKTVAVYGKSTGTANITVTADNGLSATVPIEVIDTVFADDIAIETYNLNMYVGESFQLPYTLSPAEATEIPTFRSSEKYISVDKNGVVTASRSGSAQIYAEIANGQDASCIITASYELKSMSFAVDQVEVVPGAAKYMYLNSSPQEAYNCKKHVVSSDPEIVQVNEEWIDYSEVSFTGLKPGTATITVTADNGISCSLEVVVLDGDYAETISVIGSNRLYTRIGIPYQLEYVLGSSDGRTEFKDEKVTFTVDGNGYFMDVDENGVVTAFAPGSGMIFASITNGRSIRYTITAYDLPEAVSFDREKYVVNLNGDGTYAYASGSPDDSTHCPLTYTIEDTSIAEVDGTNHIIPKSIGTTRIIATAENGVYGTAELTVRTGNYADRIGKSDYSIHYLKTGQSTQLEYELYSDSGGTDFSDETVTWYVREGSEYMSVDDTGMVSALAGGSATVIAEISNGRNITYSILTYDQPQSIQFEKSAYFVNVWSYSSPGISAYAMPESAGNCPLTYSVDDPEIIRLANWG